MSDDDKKHDCIYCGESARWTWVSAGDGQKAHRYCYERNHPPARYETLQRAIFCNALTASEVVARLAPRDLVGPILAAINDSIEADWRRRCEP